MSILDDIFTGKLTKLTFKAYKDNAFTEEDKDAGEYSVMFNPNTLSLKLQVERSESQAPGSTSSEMNFVSIKPQNYVFDFVIDGTGATGEAVVDVPEEVVKLLNVIYHYKSDEHRPDYVMIKYGAVLLKCVLKDVNITYNLFTPAGKPIRAKINCTFASALDQELSEMINSKNSPDMTHKRVIKQNEKLISVANKIYKNNDYYLDVAAKNNLNNFRKIETGTEIYFPPLSN
ncbi:MAG TPA: hypothetical protein PKK00_13405 [Bacteroidales bacterium]|nr:hypothetical protein [Bacteroidales bacterium]HPS18204.1 hypothetical protein [Bacteroidales bacterium]